MSPSKIDWSQGSYFCSNHCDSTLASIDNNISYYEAIETIKSQQSIFNDIIFIGLYSPSNNTFSWSDSTPFTFGNNTSPNGQYPWSTDNPDLGVGEECVTLTTSSYQWVDTLCSWRRAILCNDCSGKLNKYFTFPTNYNYNTAQDLCQQYQTNLASFHSKRDYNELKTLCTSWQSNCWIGLTDVMEENVFIFDDGTLFDWGNNFSAFPWYPGEPSNNDLDEHYVELRPAFGYLLNDDPGGRTKKVICNIPSELCLFVSNWTVIEGNGMIFMDCMINNNNSINGLVTDTMIMYKKHWYNFNGILLIDYYYGLNDIITADIDAKSGLIVYMSSNDSLCEYYEIGIQTFNHLSYKLYLLYSNINDQSSIITLNSMDITLDFTQNIYYLLSVEIHASSPNILSFNISINDDMYYLYYTHFRNNISLLHYGYSGSIGITAKNVKFTAKYLYISGTPLLHNNEIILPLNNTECLPTQMPSNQPTINPTINPTFVPTIDPTTNPTFVPTIDPTINPTETTSPPTENPTKTPINSITDIPSSLPESVVYTTSEFTISSITNTVDGRTDDSASDFPLSVDILIVIGFIIVFISCGIVILLCFYLKKVRKHNKQFKQTAMVIVDSNESELIEVGENAQQINETDDKINDKDMGIKTAGQHIVTPTGGKQNDNENKNINQVKDQIFNVQDEDNFDNEDMYIQNQHNTLTTGGAVTTV